MFGSSETSLICVAILHWLLSAILKSLTACQVLIFDIQSPVRKHMTSSQSNHQFCPGKNTHGLAGEITQIYHLTMLNSPYLIGSITHFQVYAALNHHFLLVNYGSITHCS